MTLDKILEGLTVSEVIKPTVEPTQLDESKIQQYFNARNTPYVFYSPYSVQRNAKLKNNEDETKPNEPTS